MKTWLNASIHERREFCRNGALALTSLFLSEECLAFGEDGAFHARLLQAGEGELQEELGAARQWARELTRRTSAPGRLAAESVRPESGALLQEPFVVWAGSEDPGVFSPGALRSLREYLTMGGILLVDDRNPASSGAFKAGAQRELARVLPQSGVLRLPPDHVLYKTFYLLEQPVGRLRGPDWIDAIYQGKSAQVFFLSHDLLGALAREGDSWKYPMEGGGSESREQAVRFAVNIAMYVLCSDYKDDQVHAPFLMRRRHKRR